MPIVVIGLSHHTSPIEVRERFAFAEAKIPDVLQQLRSNQAMREAVILSTCNRVELYVATDEADPAAFATLRDFLTESCAYREPLNGEIYTLGEPHSIEHLFRVACGLDYLALQHKHTGSRLNKAFQRAFNVAKQIRTETNIQRGSVSVGSVAVELAEKIFESLRDRQVMVIGAGDTSEKTARALLSRGAQSIIVSNRSYERAEALARELDGRAIHFDKWAKEFESIDIVISSTAAPHYILDRTKLEPIIKLRKNRPLLLVDIAVPRDIEPEVVGLKNIFLYNIDDLKAIADECLKRRQKEVLRCEAVIQEKAKDLLVITGATPAPS
ncbi:MAG: glutamyl-tRNA reductase [Verrucomicrobia bacterium]|nr:MAG: glutamyl-tRNA reductase [Verrucomicrobiota bacterium]